MAELSGVFFDAVLMTGFDPEGGPTAAELEALCLETLPAQLEALALCAFLGVSFFSAAVPDCL